MADRTVRAIFEARVSGAQKGMRDLSTDVDKTGKKVEGLEKDLKTLDKLKVKPAIDLAIDKAQKEIDELKAEIDRLDAMEATPEVLLDSSRAQFQLAAAEAALKELSGRKAEMQVTADTSQAEDAFDDVADAGRDAGDDAGEGIANGILDGLRSIPIAGAVIGIGAAIGSALLLGVQQGLQVEVERDLFGARTGLDEATAAKFGRSAGEAYANAWGDSIAANLGTAQEALRAGLLDPESTEQDIERVIAQLSGLSDVLGVDIPTAARAAGQMVRTGLVANGTAALDLLTIGAQSVETEVGDLAEVFAESSATLKQFGIDGKTALGLFKQAADAGAPSADFLIGALEELAGNAGDSSDIFKELGLNGAEMAKRLTGGGEQAAEGLGMLLDALRETEDPAKRTTALVALFGEEATAMQEVLLALDTSNAVTELEALDESAGAADRALATMSDNTAAQMESAKRNVQLAVEGIQGALAEAFGDDISGVAEWVQRNRAPLLEFFLSVINGTLDMAEAFVEFGATGLDVIADLADGFATLVDSIPSFLFPDGEEAADGLRAMADGAREAADGIRENIPPALDEVRDKANDWAAPEILKARVHDATVAMTQELEDFAAEVGEGDIGITINGDTVNAEEALAELVENINAEDGTVTINGNDVPAEEALDAILRLIANGEEDVTVGADTGPAKKSLNTYKGLVSRSEATMDVYADTRSAEQKLDDLTNTRYVTIQARVATSYGGPGRHEGGWIGAGLHAGGRVPGSDPGFDNVLWPLNTGGRTLMQPLSGGEFVMNSKDAAYWGPLLDWMNGGGRPVQTFNETSNAPVYIDKVVGLTIAEVEREAATRRRRDALSPARRGS